VPPKTLKIERNQL